MVALDIVKGKDALYFVLEKHSFSWEGARSVMLKVEYCAELVCQCFDVSC